MSKPRKSIKRKMWNLILSLILFLVIGGCTCAILIYIQLMENTELVNLRSIVANFYDQVVLESGKEAREEAKDINSYLTLNEYDKDSILEYLKSKTKTHESILLEAKNTDGSILYSTLPSTLDTTNAYENLSTENKTWILGNKTDGLYIFSITRFSDSNPNGISSILTCRPLADKDFIKQVNENFSVDATIFYQDVRLETSIKYDNKYIVGTTLQKTLSTSLLDAEKLLSTKTSISGKEYLTAYKSFGNPGEKPIGILFVGNSIDAYSNYSTTVVVSICLLGVVLFTISFAIYNRFLERNISKPIGNFTSSLSKLVTDQEVSVENIEYRNQYVEFDILGDSINSLIERLDRSQNNLKKLAYKDNLTGLPNRHALIHKYNNSEVFEVVKYVCYIDTGGLRMANDLYGRKAGDTLIIGLSTFLRTLLMNRHQYELYHLGGDIFAMIVVDDISRDKLEKTLTFMLKRFLRPFNAGGNELFISLRIGVAQRDAERSDSLENLLQNAEIAVNEVKRQAENKFEFFHQDMLLKLKRQKELEDDLVYALHNDEFMVYFQPKVNLHTGRCDCFEALIRWNSKTKGFIPPSEFIPVAEKSTLIVAIGQWVLEESCRIVKKLIERYDFPYKVSVNFSAIQLKNEDFFRNVLKTLVDHNMETEHLEIEITESVVIESINTTIEKLRQLNVLGIDVSIDDFGKGYSSLAYLKQLPINSLKIDKMFIDAILTDGGTIAEDIIQLGHHMGLEVIAEGVETKEQFEFIKKASCDKVQGYYYSRPLPFDQLIEFLDMENNVNS